MNKNNRLKTNQILRIGTTTIVDGIVYEILACLWNEFDPLSGQMLYLYKVRAHETT